MMQAEMFKALCDLTGREKLDATYHATFYLLATDEELFGKARAHVNYDGIDFAAIKRSCRGMTERQWQMLDVAHNLFSWSNRCSVTPFALAHFGYPLLDYVCSALYIANGSVSVQVRENAAGLPELALDDSKQKQIAHIYHSLSSLSGWSDECEENDMEIG